MRVLTVLIFSLTLLSIGCKKNGSRGTNISDATTGKKYPGPCVVEWCGNSFGSIEFRQTYTYNIDAKTATIEEDDIALGIPHQDWMDEGTVERTASCTYDDNWNMLTIKRFTNRNNEDMEASTFTYDNNGNVLTEDWDSNADGNVVHYSYTYTFDSDGKVLVKESSRGTNGEVYNRWTYTYEDNGKRFIEERDMNLDGEPDESQIYTLDEFGNTIKIEEDRDVDGEIDSYYILSYDCWE